MTYDAKEKSADQGKPVEIYDFFRSYLHWRYTSANQDVVVGINTYTHIPIKRGPIEQSAEINRASMRIQVARDNPIADMFRVAPPSDEINLILSQYHEGDGELAALWSGRVVNVEWAGSIANLIMEPARTSIKRTGLRRKYQRACPYALYGPGCRVSMDSYRLNTSVGSISGLTVSGAGINSFADGYYAGGFVEWEVSSGVYDTRYITSHVGAELELANAPYGLSVGQAIRVYPGCDHALSTCNTKFANVANFGGQPYIPLKNPFGSDPIY